MPASVSLPRELREALDSDTPTGSASTAASARRLSQRYLADRPATAPILATAADTAGYLATRMPATYAAVRFALAQLHDVVPSLDPVTLLDLGAGTGAATWAAWDAFAGLRRVELRDYSAPALDVAARLLAPTGLDVATRLGDVTASVRRSDPAPDVAICAYVLSELDDAQRAQVVATLTREARDAVVIVEPGTPAGYRRILAVRDALRAAGWTLAAPCPHESSCPVATREGDWCHAAVRLPRTREHRQAKGGERGFEDEKLSWVAAVRDPVRHRIARPARVLRHPQTHPGHIRLELCTPWGERVERTVSKRDGVAFRAARKVEWGEGWDVPEPADREPTDREPRDRHRENSDPRDRSPGPDA